MHFIIETHKIYVEEDGRELGYVLFPATGAATVEVTSTFVDESLRGKGVAGQLMESLVNTLRERGWKAKPICSYAVTWFSNHPEHQDLFL